MGDEEPEVAAVVEEAPAAPAEEFAFGTLEPEISYTTKQVQPPALCYISPDDSLLIQAWNVVAGVVLVVNARILKPDGTLIQSTWTYTPTAAAALNEWREGLAEGFLLTLSVDSAQARAGACYVRVRLLRGAAAGVYLVSQTMAAGYVVMGSGLSWPYPRFVGPCEGPGRLRLITGTDPAAGAQVLEVVPAGVRWRLLAVRAVLITNATVVDRYVLLCMEDGTPTRWWASSPVVAQPASIGYTYQWTLGLNAGVGPLAFLPRDVLPGGVTCPAGWRILTDAYGFQAGDNWMAPVLYVEEWVEP